MQYFKDTSNNLFGYEDSVTGDLLNLFVKSNHLTPYVFPVPLTVSIISQVSPTLTAAGETVFSIVSPTDESLTVSTGDNQILLLESNTNYTLTYPYNSNISISNNNESYPLISYTILSQSIVDNKIPPILLFNYSISGSSIIAVPSTLQVNLIISAVKLTAGSYLNYVSLVYNLSVLVKMPESFIITALQNGDISDIQEILTIAIGNASTTTNPTLAQVQSIQSICQIYGLPEV